MTESIDRFAALLAPLTPDAFFAEYYDKQPVHIRGGADKFADIMTLAHLEDLLSQTAIWSGRSLQVVADNTPVPPDHYCTPADTVDRGTVLRPVAAKVQALIEQGSTLILNDIDALVPSLATIADTIEAVLGGKAQGNLYFSRQEKQGFGSHFDTHDVFALHTVGQKRWNIYETRMPHPIAHPRFKNFGEAYHRDNRGDLLMAVDMEPGDLLYIPRGQYHDALATGDVAVHIALGITMPIGLDVVGLMYDLLVEEDVIRRPAPRPVEGRDDANYLADVAETIKRVAEDPRLVERFAAFRQQFHFTRGRYDLAHLGPPVRQYRHSVNDLSVITVQGRPALAVGSKAVPIPAGTEAMLRWIVEKPTFSLIDFDSAFDSTPSNAREKLLQDLISMKVIAVH